MPVSEANELWELRELATPLGLHVGEHREWRDGPYFVNRGNFDGSGVLKFATAKRVRDFLFEYAKPKPPVEEYESELVSLRNLARSAGYWVGEHKTFNPATGGGPYYVMPRKMYPGQRCPTLLAYATAEMVEDFLNNESAAGRSGTNQTENTHA